MEIQKTIYRRVWKENPEQEEKAIQNQCPNCLSQMGDEQAVCQKCGTDTTKKVFTLWFYTFLAGFVFLATIGLIIGGLI